MGKFWLHTLGSVSLIMACMGLAPVLRAQGDVPAPPPNVFSDAPSSGPEFAPDPHQSRYCPRWELSAEVVYFLFRRPEPRFPLATSGSLADPLPAALGQSGTKVIADSNTFPENLHVGGKVTGTYWLMDEPECMGIQANFFIMELATTSFAQASQGTLGDAALGRPFFNVALGREDVDPRAIPGFSAGNVNMGFNTRLMGADASFLYNVSGYNPLGASFFLLAGPRFLKFDENFASDEFTTTLPVNTGTTIFVHDNFTTRNIFYGGQIGAQFRYRLEGVTLDVTGKVAAGNNNERLTIGGFTSVTDQSTQTNIATGNQGLFAQPSNIGQYSHNSFSVIPEIGVNLHVNLTEVIKVTMSYNFLSMSHMARPADQLDRNINLQPVGTIPPGTPGFPARPTSITETTFWAHYFGIGLELVF